MPDDPLSLSRARIALPVAALLLSVSTVGFFLNLSTAVTDYSWGDASYHLQVWHNFLAGRPFQTSLYHNPYHGVLQNPAPFANQAAVHINLTPLLFLPFFALKPDLYGLYALTILVVMVPTLAAIAALFRDSALPAPERSSRLALVLAAVLLSSLFRLAHYKAHMLLFATPFFLAMDAAARRRRIPAYLAFASLTALAGEDSAMLVMSHAAYLWLCDPDLRRPALAASGSAAAILGAMAFVLMPAARREMTLASASHVGFILAHPERFVAALKHFPREARIAGLFLPSLIAARFAFDPGPRSSDGRLLGLVFVAPAAHWLITLLNYGAHHLVPPLICMILAFAQLVSDGRPAWSDRRRYREALAFGALFVLTNLANLSRDFPVLTAEEKAESATNRAFIRKVREKVPPDATLVLWSNEGVESFLADRVAFWRFPEYCDRAEYVAVQPGARRSWLAEPPSPGSSVAELFPPRWSDEQPIPAESIAWLRQTLAVPHGAYRIEHEDTDLLLLRRTSREDFPVPPSSIGFGYLRNVRLR